MLRAGYEAMWQETKKHAAACTFNKCLGTLPAVTIVHIYSGSNL